MKIEFIGFNKKQKKQLKKKLSNDWEALRIKKKAKILKRRINEDTGDYNFEEEKWTHYLIFFIFQIVYLEL